MNGRKCHFQIYVRADHGNHRLKTNLRLNVDPLRMQRRLTCDSDRALAVSIKDHLEKFKC